MSDGQAADRLNKCLLARAGAENRTLATLLEDGASARAADVRSLPDGVHVFPGFLHLARARLFAWLQRHLPLLLCRGAVPRERHLFVPDAPGALARLPVEGIEPAHATVRVEGVHPHESAPTDTPAARGFIVEQDLRSEFFGLL